MNFELLHTGDNLKVNLIGQLDDENAATFKESFMKKFSTETGSIAEVDFDVAQLNNISPNGMRSMLSIKKSLCEKSIAAKILNPHGQIRDMMRITGFYNLFDIEGLGA